MEEDGQTTPFWLQSSTYFQSSNHHRRRWLSSFCLNSGFLIVVLSIFALITIFFVIPSVLSFTSQVFRPNLVKKSWDHLNFVLVLFAIFCGILGRKRDDGESNGDVGIASNAIPVSEEPQQQPVQQQHQQQWYGYSDQGIHEPIHMSNKSNMVGMMKRNSSSYPDLRQASWVSSDDQNWRFYDDNYVYNERLGSSSVYRRKQRQEEDVVQDLGVKTIPVDRYVVPQQELSPPPPLPVSPPSLSPPRQSTPPPPPPLPPPPRPTSVKKHKARQTLQSVPHREHSERKEMEFKKIESPPQQPSPPTQSSPEMSTKRSEKKAKKHERKKSGGAKEIASTLASLYNQRKRKKKHKSKETFDDIFPSPSYTYSGPPPSPPPPPPPPPPPASVFNQLFKKGSKSKRIHSFSASSSSQQHKPSPPTPPPLPPMSPLRSSKRKPQTKRPMPQTPPPPPPAPSSEVLRPRKPMTPGRPPLPSKINSLYDDNSNTGNQSPLIPMPPPPPPPPFKMQGFKFVVRGDYVRLQSSHSTRSSSPDLDFTDTPPTSTPVTPTTIDGEEAGVSVFCPSPDVNTKADSFIARFRAGLRMEKVNSFKDKQEMNTSNPSPKSKPTSS